MDTGQQVLVLTSSKAEGINPDYLIIKQNGVEKKTPLG
jgi:hypothetical protein